MKPIKYIASGISNAGARVRYGLFYATAAIVFFLWYAMLEAEAAKRKRQRAKRIRAIAAYYDHRASETVNGVEAFLTAVFFTAGSSMLVYSLFLLMKTAFDIWGGR